MLRPGFSHFLEIAAGSQWDEADIDLAGAARSWPALPEGRRARIERLVAGFCLGEAEFAADLEPFARFAGDRELAECFAAQARDEERHARFFDRFAREVLGTPGESRAERSARLATLLTPAFRSLFGERLPGTARRLAEGRGGLDAAVGLYHLLLEGVVFSAGLLALLEELGHSPVLSEARRGVGLVVRDERWHLGLGVSCFASLEARPEQTEELLAEARATAGCWGDAVSERTLEHVLFLHRRRLGLAVGAAYLAPV